MLHGRAIIRLLSISMFSILLANKLMCFSFTALQTIPCNRKISQEVSNLNLLKLSSSLLDNDDVDVDVDVEVEVEVESMDSFGGYIHHTALKTRNICLAIEFYSLLGFEPIAKFKAGGGAKAAWLEQQQETTSSTRTSSNHLTISSSSPRIELIEVPSHLLNEPEGMKRRALDLFQHQEYLGMNHFALDVTNSIRNSNLTDVTTNDDNNNNNLILSIWMKSLNERSLKLFNKNINVALEAEQFMVGNTIYERAMVYDADGSLVELLRKATKLPQQIDPMSGWDQYNEQWI
mmetsp:Transcript_62089/g.69509  ORF Transcript_62089/g.69509 Transcript_62089/m.69509 type:complete len:290 (-) Transcript_62089:1298-2167(-)